MSRTADELLTAVKYSGAIPASQALLSDERILGFADEEIEAVILPAIQSLNQNYLLTVEDVATVEDQQSYAIPVRALGRTLVDLKLVDGSGYVRNMAQITLQDADTYTSLQTTPGQYYFMGDRVCLVPTPSSDDYSLRMYYLQRPGRLVSTNACARITAVVTGASSTTFTVNQVPSGFAVGSACDFIQGLAGNSLLDSDELITNIAGTDITFGVVSTDIAVGDYIAPQYYSPVLQFPEEGFSLLQARTSHRCLLAIGDIENAELLSRTFAEKMRFFESMLAPRMANQQIKIMPNRNGFLRGNRPRYGRYTL